MSACAFCLNESEQVDAELLRGACKNLLVGEAEKTYASLTLDSLLAISILLCDLGFLKINDVLSDAILAQKTQPAAAVFSNRLPEVCLRRCAVTSQLAGTIFQVSWNKKGHFSTPLLTTTGEIAYSDKLLENLSKNSSPSSARNEQIEEGRELSSGEMKGGRCGDYTRPRYRAS